MKKEVLFRLAKHVTFLEEELKDHEKFKNLSWEGYNQDRSKRRDVERWIENIINSSIDIAKIILASEGLPLADTYKDIVSSLSLVSGFGKEAVEKLSGYVKLLNIITHEYLDLRWSSIKKFISEAAPFYNELVSNIKNYLNMKMK
ncbi:MAG: DUF86 domain-containing protein [Candidatus Brocadia sp.]|jgi:uncharacterized protein YutE (UPF0331/DUF86 family)